MITAKELRSHFGTTCECADCKVAKQAADTIDQLTRERDEALRKVAMLMPVVRKAAEMVESPDHYCWCTESDGHTEWCPQPDAQRAIEEAEEKRNEYREVGSGCWS